MTRTRTKRKDRKDDAVFYNLNPQQEELSVTEETRLMMVDSGSTRPAGTGASHHGRAEVALRRIRWIHSGR